LQTQSSTTKVNAEQNQTQACNMLVPSSTKFTPSQYLAAKAQLAHSDDEESVSSTSTSASVRETMHAIAHARGEPFDRRNFSFHR